MVATIAAISRERKAQLRQLMVASRRLDADQERLEREVKRLITRKKAVPELEDAQRLTEMAQAVNAAVDNMAAVIRSVGQTWGARM